jgi:periplasmic protein TonB
MKKIIFLFVAFICNQITTAQAPLSTTKSIPINFEAVELSPQFPDGLQGFMKYISDNFKPSDDESEDRPTGTIKMSIVIGADGKVSQINVLKNVGNLGEEVKRVISKAPNWIPGSNGGSKVAVVYNFDIQIR